MVQGTVENLIQFGILGIFFLMVITRQGLMTTKAHEEVVQLYKEQIAELKIAYEAEKEGRAKAEESSNLAIKTANVATQTLEAFKIIAIQQGKQ